MLQLLSLFGAVAFALVFLGIPGLLVARLALVPGPRSSGDALADPAAPVPDRLLVALVWGFGMVPTFAFFLHLFTFIPVTFATLALSGLLNAGVAGFCLLRRDRSGSLAARLLPFDRAELAERGVWPVLGASALVGVAYFLKFDNTGPVEWSCLHESAFIAVGLKGGVDLLRDSHFDARLGNTGVLSGMMAVFGAMGLRLLYGLIGMLLALGGHAIGRWVGRRAAWGWFGMAFLALNPYVTFIPRLDENLLTLAFATALVPFLARLGSSWLVGGTLFGLVVTMRHCLLPAILAMGAVLVTAPRRMRAIGAFLAAFVVVTIPENLHHLLAMGSLLRFETNNKLPPFPYQFLGFDFQWPGLMNWPFLEQVIRTPHNPFPNFLLWPLNVADHLGLILTALMLLGFVAIWARSRTQALFWLLWSAPVVAGLAVQENWDYANKVGVILIVFGAVAAWVVAGAAFVGRRPVVGLVAVALLAGGLHVGIRGVRDWRVPADPRYYAANPVSTLECPQRVEREAERLTRGSLLPNYGRLAAFGPFLSGRKVTELWRDIQTYRQVVRHPWGWFPREASRTSDPVTVRLDLRRPLDDRTDLLTVVEASAGLPAEGEVPLLDVLGAPGRIDVRDVRVPWDSRPLVLQLAVGPRNSGVALFFQDPPIERLPSGCQTCNVEHGYVDMLYGLLGTEVMSAPPVVVRDVGPILDIRLPAGSVSVALMTNLGAARGILWKAHVTPDGAQVAAPFQLWHN